MGRVEGMSSLRRPLRFPGWGTQLISVLLAITVVVPLLQRLPKLAVVACFDAGHPLYSLVPTTADGAHCVTAPTPVVGWTLMVAATLLIHLVLMPAALLAVVLLLRGARWVAGAGRRLLAAALAQLDDLVVVWWRPAPAPAAIRVTDPARARANPRRGPPALS